MADATTELARLQAERGKAEARVDGLEREWRSAVAAAREASAALAEGERQGLSTTKRHALEEALAVTKAKAAEPWAERVEGAKAAVRDADQLIRQHIASHLGELVEALETDGRVAAEKVNQAAGLLLSAYLEREQVAQSLGALISQVSRVEPGDVSYSRAAQAARACTGLVDAGGEEPVQLRRDREPWARLLGVLSGASAGMSADLHQLRSEVAAAHGLGAEAVGFLDATTLEGLEAQAASLVRVLGTRTDQPSQEPAATPDPILVGLAEKAARKQALVATFTGRPPQPRDESGRYTGFDGGARQPLPVPRDPEQEHGELVSRLAAARRLYGGSDF